MPGGTSTQTTTNVASSAPSNPDVNPTLSGILKGVQAQQAKTPEGYYFDKSMYGGTGATTDNALSSILSGANNPAAGQAFGNTFNEVSDIAAGNRFGMNDPGYAALRSGLQDDVTTANLSAFNNSGLFGSDSNRGQLTKDLTRELGGLDYANFQSDIARQQQAQAAQSGAFANTLAPGKAALGVGQMQDADTQAALQGEADWYTRKMGAPTDFLAKLSSLLAGNAATGGMNSTSSSTVPVQQQSPLQMLLGGGLGIASLL